MSCFLFAKIVHIFRFCNSGMSIPWSDFSYSCRENSLKGYATDGRRIVKVGMGFSVEKRAMTEYIIRA